MIRIDTIKQLRSVRRLLSSRHRKVAFVPTMGALHEGHLSLVRVARSLVGQRGAVGVSIFVNPTQFNQKSDLQKYPRPLRRDLNLCREAGVDFVFVPSEGEMYPEGFSTWVEEVRLSKPLCGACRPGHFRGVCTVVLKLFNIIQPDVAVFGQKDAQQVRVIEKMVADLDIPVQVVVAPTVREKEGLAMSSRNQRLSSRERQEALALVDSLKIVRLAFQEGICETRRLRQAVMRYLNRHKNVRLEYLEFVDGKSLQGVSRLRKGDLVAIAAFVGRTRLIDNLVI